jgi:SAM-dependent methyltransferase
MIAAGSPVHRGRLLEIGCNDGSLLELLVERGFECIGVDPAITMQARHAHKSLSVIYEFFGETLAETLRAGGAFDRVVALNVLAHFPDFVSAFRGARSLLTPSGYLHLEVADATETLANGRFDTIYHEHLCNYTLTSIDAVLRSTGLRGIHAERIPTQGGSLRVLAARDDGELLPQRTYQELLQYERAAGVNTAAFYADVKAKTLASIAALSAAYSDFCRDDSPVLLLGAPARGVVMCNSTPLRHMRHLRCIDDSPSKQGCVIPGTDISIGDWSVVERAGAHKAILLSWNYRDAMLARLAEAGFKGEVLIPLPELEVITLS